MLGLDAKPKKRGQHLTVNCKNACLTQPLGTFSQVHKGAKMKTKTWSTYHAHRPNLTTITISYKRKEKKKKKTKEGRKKERKGGFQVGLRL